MKAITIEQFGGPNQLKPSKLPTPPVADNEVQIQIHYTSVNPVDWKIREGYLANRLPHAFPIILGWDAAGVITAVGANVKKWKVGDEVFAYCRKPTVQWGTYAEYISVEENSVAAKPKNLTFAQAAAIPLVGLTAWQALFDAAKLKKGETVLIQAGAGGVGSLAVGLAKQAGATVITTASASHHDYLKKLGADNIIDYKKENVLDKVKKLYPKGIDVVLETIGGKTLEESMKMLKPGGRLISILEQLDPQVAAKNKIEFHYVFVSPNGAQLQQIGSLLENRQISLPAIEEMALADAAVAQEQVRQGHTEGKIVLKVKE